MTPSVIAERAEYFAGRDWVFREVDRWLAQDPGGRYFLITGEPGSGKTAIAARLFQFSSGDVPPNGYRRIGPQTLGAAHFCSARDAISIDPRSFAASLALQLSARSQAYAQALKNVGDKVININVQATSQRLENFTGVVIQNLDISRISPQDAFNRVVIDPLLETGQPFTILVDSLDEALRHSGDVTIVKLLSNVASLPATVRFILTSRLDNRVESRFTTADGMVLSAAEHRGQNRDDIVKFATRRLNAAGFHAGLPALIADKAEGNFQYAKFVVKAILDAQMDPSKLSGLPAGLDAIYHESLTRVVDLGGKSWSNDYAPVMGALSVARERFTLDQLRTFSAQSETAVWNCLNDLQQFIESDDADDPRYSLYHHSVTEFFQRRLVAFSAKTLRNDFYLPPAEWHRRLASRYTGASAPSAWDLYGLRYSVQHLAQAARLSSGAERHAAVQALVGLTADPVFRDEHQARVRNLPQLQRDLEEAVDCAALDAAPEALESIVRSALNLVQFRRDELRPEPLFDLALRGDPESAAARLPLFDVDAEWHQIATVLMAWLAVDVSAPQAQALRDRVAAMQPLSPRAARLIEFFDAWTGAGPSPARDPLPPVLPPEVVQAIVDRMGGSGAIAMAELLAAHNIPEVRNPSLRANEGYLSQHDGPHLVGFAEAVGGPGDALLRQYIEIHTGYQYVQYRNRSLAFLLDAMSNHRDPWWVRGQSVQIATSALAGSRSDFQEALPLAVLAVRAGSDPVATASLESRIQQAVAFAEALHSGRQSDPLSRSKRWLAVLVEALDSLRRPAECHALVGLSLGILRTGFAGYSAPACLTLAEAIEIAQDDPYPGALRDALDAALSAAHNVQDPLFCARITTRVHALRADWWDTSFDLEATVDRFTSTPDAPEFCPTFRVRERYEHRSPDSMQMDPELRDADTVARIERAFRRRPGELTPINPGVDRDTPLPDGFSVRLPDPGFATWLAARFAARASADRALAPVRRIAILRALVPLAAANPTALDTVLARLVFAEQPASSGVLDRLAGLAAAAIVEPGAMAAALPDSAFPA
jgi:hypothetical protein